MTTDKRRRLPLSTDYTCSRVLREHWYVFGCDKPAVVVYLLPGGEKAGWCNAHRRSADEHARLRGWLRIDPAGVAA